MHDWQHYIQIIKRETEPAMDAMLARMKNEQGIHTRIDPNRLIRDERLFRKTTDAAMRHWIKRRSFSVEVVKPEIVPYLHIRFNSALAFLEELNSLHLKIDSPEKRFLTWLLIRRWRTQGRAEWICNMFPDDWPA